MTISETAVLLNGLDNVYILTHERPDGDTLGSAAALCVGLRALGKTAFVLPNPELTPRYVKYVAPYHAAAGLPPDGATLIAVDTASPERLPPAHRALACRVLLSVDHHPASAGMGTHNCLQADCAATGEIIFEILRELGGHPGAFPSPGGVSEGRGGRCPSKEGEWLTQEIALPLYLALSTDTGCFRYTNTTARTHRVAAALLDTGIDVAALNREMFETKSLRRFQVEALMVESMEFFSDGTVVLCYLTQDMIHITGATEDDVDNIAALPRKIEGVDIGVVIKEQPGGLCKISMRTSNKYMANRVCARLGGGGHPQAAGCTVKGAPADARQAILAALETYFAGGI